MFRGIPMVLVILFPLLTACQGTGEVVESLHHPVVVVDLVRLKGIGADYATCEVVFTIRNPYSSQLTVAGYDYQLTSGETPLLSGRYERHTVVAANDSAIFLSSFPISFEQVANALAAPRLGLVVPYQVEFSVLVTPQGRSVTRLPATAAGDRP